LPAHIVRSKRLGALFFVLFLTLSQLPQIHAPIHLKLSGKLDSSSGRQIHQDKKEGNKKGSGRLIQKPVIRALASSE
jgi:hypothetical protein